MIPINEPLLDGNEQRYLIQCIETGWISSEGPFVQQFEQRFAERIGRNYAIAVCNGSAALDAAVAALQIGPGDEVILPAFTIISCAAAVVRSGATPVVADCEPDTWNINVEQIEARISARTKAIMVVHIYGLPVNMHPIIDLAGRYGLKIIEDAAQMHGQTCANQPCGSFGAISTFSFYPNKLVSTGEGGMILTDDKTLAERCRSLRNLCFQPERRFVHEELGWNMRMSNLQAALGLAQLERLEEFVERKRRMGKRYTELLGDISALQLPVQKKPYADNIYWVYAVVLKDEVAFDGSGAMRRLSKRGIATRPFFWPIHKQPVFIKMGLFKGVNCPVAERIAQRGFYIPSGLTLSDGQLEQVSEALHEITG